VLFGATEVRFLEDILVLVSEPWIFISMENQSRNGGESIVRTGGLTLEADSGFQHWRTSFRIAT